ncbi:hypothetical protein MA16_Dca005565 [Dendrobium catenatum]|uniref:Uncharacterized protein n=1 Tax=Dendrobium catenatum TaxID=906689 RepID=A0A2I0WQ05_9ASPA|nr:hypothetical protein MA16_Dca005565 [Dendrobium catenatum]
MRSFITQKPDKKSLVILPKEDLKHVEERVPVMDESSQNVMKRTLSSVEISTDKRPTKGYKIVTNWRQSSIIMH